MAPKRALTAAALFACALFLAVSFVSFDGVSDPETVGPYANLCGVAGKAVAAALLKTFGAGAFALAFFLMFVGYSVLTARPLVSPLVKCAGAIAFSIVLAAAIQALDPAAGYGRSPYPFGGVAGERSAALLLRWFGGLGTAMILLLLGASTLVLATDRFLVDLVTGLTTSGRALVRGLRLPRFAVADGDPAMVADLAAAPAAAPRRRGAGRPLPVEDGEPEEDDGDEASLDAGSSDELDEVDDAYEEEPDVSYEEAEIDAEDEEEEEDGFLLDDELAYDEESPLTLDAEDLAEEEPDELFADEVEEPAPRPEPVIRRGGVTTDDDVEILMLSREKHLEDREMYPLPPLSLLADPQHRDVEERDHEIKRKAHKLEETLETFGIQAQVVAISRGPTITVYELELAAGTKVKRITSLPDDISLALKAKTIRIVAPIPGKAAVGIEVPNDTREPVFLKTLARSDVLQSKQFNIPLLLGMDSAGDPLIEDLTAMPHLLIAGQTGAGKSVCINSIIASLLLTKYPEQVRLILIDPKMVELQAFRDVPHLLTPVVTDMRKAPKILDWAVNEMEQRYELLAAAGVRDIKSFNELEDEEKHERLAEHHTTEEIERMQLHLPYVVLIVDELADLMMTSAKEVEQSICRLAQKSRAVGIHVILATQRPSVDVITGLIKANIPSRIAPSGFLEQDRQPDHSRSRTAPRTVAGQGRHALHVAAIRLRAGPLPGGARKRSGDQGAGPLHQGRGPARVQPGAGTGAGLGRNGGRGIPGSGSALSRRDPGRARQSARFGVDAAAQTRHRLHPRRAPGRLHGRGRDRRELQGQQGT